MNEKGRGGGLCFVRAPVDAHEAEGPLETGRARGRREQAEGASISSTETDMTNVIPLGADPSPATEPTSPPPWMADLRPGAIVVHRYPAPGRMGAHRSPEPRPCLVVDVYDLHGHGVVALAHGVPAASGIRRDRDLVIAARELRGVPELPEAHRFVASACLLVPLGSPAFVVDPERGTPVLGHLSGEAMARLDDLRARLHAEADIAAEDRRRRGRRRREGATRDHDFTVERRHRRRRSSPLEVRLHRSADR